MNQFVIFNNYISFAVAVIGIFFTTYKIFKTKHYNSFGIIIAIQYIFFLLGSNFLIDLMEFDNILKILCLIIFYLIFISGLLVIGNIHDVKTMEIAKCYPTLHDLEVKTEIVTQITSNYYFVLVLYLLIETISNTCLLLIHSKKEVIFDFCEKIKYLSTIHYAIFFISCFVLLELFIENYEMLKLSIFVFSVCEMFLSILIDQFTVELNIISIDDRNVMFFVLSILIWGGCVGFIRTKLSLFLRIIFVTCLWAIRLNYINYDLVSEDLTKDLVSTILYLSGVLLFPDLKNIIKYIYNKKTGNLEEYRPMYVLDKKYAYCLKGVTKDGKFNCEKILGFYYCPQYCACIVSENQPYNEVTRWRDPSQNRDNLIITKREKICAFILETEKDWYFAWYDQHLWKTEKFIVPDVFEFYRWKDIKPTLEHKIGQWSYAHARANMPPFRIGLVVTGQADWGKMEKESYYNRKYKYLFWKNKAASLPAVKKLGLVRSQKFVE